MTAEDIMKQLTMQFVRQTFRIAIEEAERGAEEEANELLKPFGVRCRIESRLIFEDIPADEQSTDDGEEKLAVKCGTYKEQND